MRNEDIFRARLERIERTAGPAQRRRSRQSRRMGERMISPVMFMALVCGGITAYWDAQDRPTDSPLSFAAGLTEQLLAYLATI